MSGRDEDDKSHKEEELSLFNSYVSVDKTEYFVEMIQRLAKMPILVSLRSWATKLEHFLLIKFIF